MASQFETVTVQGYTVTVLRADERSAAARVESPAGNKYAVQLGQFEGFCSCPDSMFRGPKACKHQGMVVVAFRQIRQLVTA